MPELRSDPRIKTRPGGTARRCRPMLGLSLVIMAAMAPVAAALDPGVATRSRKEKKARLRARLLRRGGRYFVFEIVNFEKSTPTSTPEPVPDRAIDTLPFVSTCAVADLTTPACASADAYEP